MNAKYGGRKMFTYTFLSNDSKQKPCVWAAGVYLLYVIPCSHSRMWFSLWESGKFQHEFPHFECLIRYLSFQMAIWDVTTEWRSELIESFDVNGMNCISSFAVKCAENLFKSIAPFHVNVITPEYFPSERKWAKFRRSPNEYFYMNRNDGMLCNVVTSLYTFNDA